MKKNLLKCVALSFLALLIAPQFALALGQVTEPINIDNALRGQQIHQEITALNGQDKPITVEFAGSGQIKDWVKFYRTSDLKNAISTTTIEGKSYYKVTAVFSIPEGASNGDYKGMVSVIQKPDSSVNQSESYSSLMQKIDRPVMIKVSDTEFIKLDASIIPKTYDLLPNEPLNVRVIYDNQSNISLRPSVGFKIMSDNKTVYDVIFPYPESVADVNPKAMLEIPALSIPTAGMANGTYLANMRFLRGDKSITEKNFGFSINEQNSGFYAKTTDFIGKNMNLLMWSAALILLAIIGLLIKRNVQLRQGRNNASES